MILPWIKTNSGFLPHYETLCNTDLFLCHDILFHTCLFSVNNNNFLRDISKRQLLWVKVTGIISPQETHLEHLSLRASQMLSLLHIPHFWHYHLFLCNHCKKIIPLSFPTVVRKLSQKLNHWKSHYQVILWFSSCPKQNYHYTVPPYALSICGWSLNFAFWVSLLPTHCLGGIWEPFLLWLPSLSHGCHGSYSGISPVYILNANLNLNLVGKRALKQKLNLHLSLKKKKKSWNKLDSHCILIESEN